ncbi:helix-turn-helix domain-containing protein [Pseudonocardia acaciae]|uniref:helix-turn-helix domain-containing protein n=1 Tax=Pseudonocardia acaciae TaxID=551276 RepID=UPI00048A6157|nr:helix-turn-helix transcriptional regulator [Pseudonocardia acaciae]
MPDRTTGGRDALSRTLRELRQAAGLSGKEAAEAAGIYASKISRIERGRTVPSEEDARLLAAVYRATPEERDRIVAMARDVKAENRRVVFKRDLGPLQQRFGRMLEQSALVRTFSPNVVPGLLQSPGYMRALFASDDETPEAVDAGIAGRLAQQRILDDELDPRRFVILMVEGALGWAAGPRELMIEQVERIIAATYRSNARVGIVPFGRPARVFPPHSWQLFDQRAVIVGTHTATAILTEPRDVSAYVELTDEVEALAAYGDEARAVLNRVIDRYRALDS